MHPKKNTKPIMPYAPPHAHDGRLTLPERIAEVVKKEMRDSARPTLRKEVVPDNYQILIHPDDYQWLSPVEEDLLKEIGEELDKVLAKLNEETDSWVKFVKRIHQVPLLGRVIKWFSGPIIRGQDRHYEVRGKWQVEIVASDDVPQGDAQIEAWVSEESAGSTETQRQPEVPGADHGKTATDPYMTFTSSLGDAVGRHGSPEKATEGGFDSAHAILKYSDDEGETETFRMTKDKVKIGRGSPSVWVDLRLEFVEKDISREHLLVRYDSEFDRLEIKNVGKFGTTVNGTTIDEEEWHPISDGATIVLAGRDDVPIDVEIPSE